jgi:hypothetical protein
VKRIVPAFLVAAAAFVGCARDPSTTLKQEAEKCAKAVLTSDHDGVVAYTHKRVVAAVGGKDAMIATLKRGLAQMRSDGVEFADVTIGLPEKPRKIGVWLVSTLPEHIVMKVPGGKLYQDAFLLGISEDDGRSWAFVDLGPVTNAEFAKVFPELDGKISVPKREKPVFRKDEG